MTEKDIVLSLHDSSVGMNPRVGYISKFPKISSSS